MPTFPDLRDFYDPALELPVSGTTYRIVPPSAADGVKLRRFMLDPEFASKRSDLDYLRSVMELLGASYDAEAEQFAGAEDSVFERLVAGGAEWPVVLRVAETAAMQFVHGEAQALAFWSQELLRATSESEPKKAPAKTSKRKR